MGMFDYISVSDSLPYSQDMIDFGLNTNNHPFQTKDLHRSLSNYIIQDGKLFEEKYKIYEWVNGDEKSDSFMDKLGHMKREDPYLEQILHHGTINFYHHAETEGYDHWIEYVAYFTHGKVEKIDLVEHRKTDNTERKAREAEFFANLRIEANKWYNKYLFHTKLWRKINRLIYSILNGIEHIIYKIKMRIP
jgi:hypothetical protein